MTVVFTDNYSTTTIFPKTSIIAMHIYQLKISLRDFKPTIYRKVLVQSTTLLPEMHAIIQVLMGWNNSHLHHFSKNRLFSFPTYDDAFYEPDFDYYSTKISDLLEKPNQRCRYEYDFGDSWDHEIVLEKILEPDENLAYPVCVKGKMNGPVEDCGGVYGYENLIEIQSNPRHKEFKGVTEWVGGIWAFEHFDLNEINTQLAGRFPENRVKKTQ